MMCQKVMMVKMIIGDDDDGNDKTTISAVATTIKYIQYVFKILAKIYNGPIT